MKIKEQSKPPKASLARSGKIKAEGLVIGWLALSNSWNIYADKLF